MTEPADHWEGCTAHELADAWGLPCVHLFNRVGSTNDLARKLAELGEPHGTVVIADEQLAGRGRVGRQWSSPAGLGVWQSLVVRPRALPNPALLPLIVGMAAAAALDRFASPGRPMIKWPNDLTLAGRKFAGILCETSWNGSAPSFVVIGIGINVLHKAGDFPPELDAFATSLYRETGVVASRREISGSVAQAVTAAALRVPGLLSGDLLEELAARDVLRGRPVEVSDTPDGSFSGEAIGIAPDGALLVRRADVTLCSVRFGTVRSTSSHAYV